MHQQFCMYSSNFPGEKKGTKHNEQTEPKPKCYLVVENRKLRRMKPATMNAEAVAQNVPF